MRAAKAKHAKCVVKTVKGIAKTIVTDQDDVDVEMTVSTQKPPVP